MSDIQPLSTAELAAVLDVSERDVRHLVQRGVLRRNPDKTFDPYQACPAGVAYLAARTERKAGLSLGESYLDDVVEAAVENLRRALKVKGAAKFRAEIESIAQRLEEVVLARREAARGGR
jgi:hypothetical protein